MESTTPSSSEEDLLSQLPSDVLVSILEKLSLRDAIRVRVLSRQWRCVSAKLSRLALDIASFLPGHAYEFHDHDDGADDDPDAEVEEDVEPAAAAVENAVNDDDPDAEEDGDVAHGPAAVDDGVHDPDDDNDYDVFSEAGDEMADTATALLASRRPPPGGSNNNNNNNNNSLDDAVHNTVTMRFYLRHNYMSLGRLLDDAVASGKVRKVELTITTTFRMFDDDRHRDRESIRRSLVGYGRRFKALFDACPAAFGAQLTQLTLEKLTLENYGPERGRLWRMRHAWLKDINIILCFPIAIQLLWLPRLESFSLRGWFYATDRLVSMGHVPRLTAVTMSDDITNEDATLRLSRIFANAHKTGLTDLRLNFCGNNIWVRPETSRRLTDAFSKLKNLKLKNVNRECGLAWTMFLLQSASHLQELYIKLMEHNCGNLASSRKNVPWEVDSSFEHYNLVRVTIARFYSTEETIVTFTRRLIQAAVNLEEICFRENAVLLCTYCDRADPDAGSKFPRTDKERDTFTKRIITDDDGRTTTAVKVHIRS